MYVDFYDSESPITCTAPSLYNVYHLEADSSYQVTHPPLSAHHKVLLLTVGGAGVLKNPLQDSCSSGFSLFSGDAFLFSPCEKTFYYHTKEENWNFWWFEFTENSLETWTAPRSFHFDPLLSGLCEACLTNLKQNNPEAAAFWGSILAHIRLQCSAEETMDSKQDTLFFQIQEIIRQNLKDITVAKLAAKAGIGERSMRDLFIRHIGCSPKQYILMLKLDMACYLLRNTSKSIEEISASLGFSSQFHFSRAFRQSFGEAPSRWRNMQKYNL